MSEEGSKRSKRIYVYWGVALALLLTTGIFRWAVAVPSATALSAEARQSPESRPQSGAIIREEVDGVLFVYRVGPDGKKELVAVGGFSGAVTQQEPEELLNDRTVVWLCLAAAGTIALAFFGRLVWYFFKYNVGEEKK